MYPLFTHSITLIKITARLAAFHKKTSDVFRSSQLQGIFFTPVPQRKLSGCQEGHGTVKASSLHLLRIQLTACGLLPAGRVYNVECNTSIAAVVTAYSYERDRL